jgi:hypothetical protein
MRGAAAGAPALRKVGIEVIPPRFENGRPKRRLGSAEQIVEGMGTPWQLCRGCSSHALAQPLTAEHFNESDLHASSIGATKCTGGVPALVIKDPSTIGKTLRRRAMSENLALRCRLVG